MPISSSAEPEASSNELNFAQAAETGATVRPQIEVTYYTDPLCSWSWAFEPHWRRLRYEFGDQLAWRYSMGGLIPDWQHFSDPINDISRPLQMAPQWMSVKHISGMPIDDRIWLEDPPASSYPACIALKASQRQGWSFAEAYLRRLREAVMLERRNIAKREVQLMLAQELAEGSNFDLKQFQQDLDSHNTLEAFREDIKEGRYRSIERFPSLILQPSSGRAVLIMGYRPYPMLCGAIAHIAPQCHPVRSASDVVSYVSYWGRVTALEVAVALNLETEAARRMLDDAVAKGTLIKADHLYTSPSAS